MARHKIKKATFHQYIMDSREELRKKLLKKTREQINEKFAGREIHIIKAVRLLSDLESINNLLMENTSEWKVRNPTGEALENFSALEKNNESIAEEKNKLVEFIEKEMSAEFPNFSAIATPVLGAKLLASAGSKQRLCFMPASTIQVLGAEKALFAHMRRHAKSPKHGHLFNHPLMQKLPRIKRGQVARIIAGKLSIALKQDYFNGEDTSRIVLKELEEKITKIFNEPITPYQEKRERELTEAHTEGRRKEQAPYKPVKKPESRTWTPEERRAYFAQQNKNEFSQKHHSPRHFSGQNSQGKKNNNSRHDTRHRNFGKGKFDKTGHQKRH
jgi:nucleolar protein 56